MNEHEEILWALNHIMKKLQSIERTISKIENIEYATCDELHQKKDIEIEFEN